MSLEEYKKKVEENLLKVSGSKTLTLQVMKDYEKDFPKLLKDGWTIEGLTPAILNYLI
ncbi:hypothetical protein J6Y73_04420 [bacterium]|nr:hypothetical protein [bacterium]